jgi:predicted enzyme related to lactoylglutathione lyase
MTVTVSPVLGRPLWYELMTTDMKAAESFYGNVVGWTSAPFEGSPHLSLSETPSSRVGPVRVTGSVLLC